MTDLHRMEPMRVQITAATDAPESVLIVHQQAAERGDSTIYEQRFDGVANVRATHLTARRGIFAALVTAGILLSQHISAAPLTDACHASCAATTSLPRVLGINYAGTPLEQIQPLVSSDLLGSLKMSGTWVSKLTADRFVATAQRACRYATDRGQDFYLQLPVTFTERQILQSLDALKAVGCALKGVSIGNEVDRLVTERIVQRYSVADYVADYNRIVPLVSKAFPNAKIIALELASFAAKDSGETDHIAIKYQPIFEWLLPFVKAKLVRKPDYVSVHYYPFTGAQKEWETLAAGRMLRSILSELAPQLAASPPLLIGEFNTTYQYEEGAVYPESGGDSFMASLTLPALLANPAVAGLFHWSLVEPVPSSLGLYQGKPLKAVPMLHSYRLLADVWDRPAENLQTSKPALDAIAFRGGTSERIVVINTSPFFRRNLILGKGPAADIRTNTCDCKIAEQTVTLPPLSITTIESGTTSTTKRLAYADRVIRSGEPSLADHGRLHCAPLANFAKQPLVGIHVENPRFNQNTKIGTGGTPIALASPGGKASLRQESGAVAIQCALPGTGSAYHQCGVKLPLVADALADRKQGTDWTDGLAKGTLRLQLEASTPLNMELHLEDYRPDALGYNTHQRKVNVSGLTTLDIPIREFVQNPGVGTASPLQRVLGNVANLRIEVRLPAFNGAFRVHRVEICDSL